MQHTQPIGRTYLIEDGPLDRLIIGKLLQKYNFTQSLLSFEDGRLAMESLRQALARDNEQALPQVILLDLQMPRMNGWHFLEQYEQLPAHFTQQCLLYVISASISPADINRAKAHPLVKAYLAKPLTAAGLAHILEDFAAQLTW
jgi:CheY-like chemotaxis protein